MTHTKLSLNAIFCDGMVLAANKPIRIFGTGEGSITVSFLQHQKTIVSKDENWLIELPASGYGGPYTMEITLDGEKHMLQNIYIGEVLLLHGQSNIEFKLWESSYPAEQYEGCDLLRLFSLSRIRERDSYQPEDGWVACTAENAGNFSAIGYHVGCEIVKRKHCAVGLIACYQGASVIQTWLPEDTEEKLDICLLPEERHADYYKETYRYWNVPGALYRYMVQKLAPYSLSRIIWYQGESNATPAEGAVYRQLLTALIQQRRIDFCDEKLPFVVVQLAEFLERAGLGWSLVQRAQMQVSAEIPGVDTVVSADVCENNRIHPPTKYLLSKRIADVILKES